MTAALPRVTYSNLQIDLAPIHAEFDARLPEFERQVLGGRHGAIVGDDRNLMDGTPLSVASPIDRDLLIGTFSSASPAVIDKAVNTAAAAAPAWAACSLQDRVALLNKFARVMSERRFDLAFASLFEVGKSRIEAIGEAEESVDLPEYYAAEMERTGGYFHPLARVRKEESTESRLLPFGVFAVIAPFNFPIALVVNMISGALVTGNTVVLKPAVGCGLSGRMIVQAALDAGMPTGVINLVLGSTDVGSALVRHPLVAGVAFTGSHRVGMEIARSAMAGDYAKPVIAEMGGKNPAYVTASADLDTAAQGVARSAFGLQGQKCSACSVAYVDEIVADKFLDKLRTFTASLKIGDPRKADTFMGSVQEQATIDRFKSSVEVARKEGEVLHGGRQLTQDFYGKGFFVEPTIVSLPRESSLTREELFMPFVAVRRVSSLAAALKEGNAVRYGLSAGVYATDQKDLDYFLNTVQAGVVYANRASGATTGAWPGIQSFCGWKGSGVSHKGGLGPHFLPQFMREQSRTIIAG